jgi:hypothetical protein
VKAMRGFAFPPTTNTGDWHQPFYIACNGAYVEWHPPDDEILFGMSPDAIAWQDYGAWRSTYPPGRGNASPPYFQASSNDTSGVVTMVSPGLVDILVPASVMRGFPPKEINIGLRFQRASDSRTSTVFLGRLPIWHGVV